MISKRLLLIMCLLILTVHIVAEGSPGLRFHFVDNQTAFQVSRGSTTDTHIIIPPTHNGLPVRRIESSGFVDFHEMTYVSLPDGLVSIGNRSFRFCTGLTSINIPDGVTSIGIAAFDGCTGLTSVTLPDGLITISNFAFSGCTSLTSIVIPRSVIRMGTGVFANCPNLTIYVEAEGPSQGWDFTWNPDDLPVVWGHVIDN